MVKVTYLPLFVTLLFRGMPGMWKNRHRLMLCWLVVMHALFPGRKTLAELVVPALPGQAPPYSRPSQVWVRSPASMLRPAFLHEDLRSRLSRHMPWGPLR
jgi:hypothetical protein